MSYNILFICSGNTCRSPMAAYLAADIKERLFPESDFRFDSAGIATSDGFPATENAVAALAEWNIDLRSHRSKAFQPYMAKAADCMVCMTEMHRDILARSFPEEKNKIFLIGELSGSDRDIPDPYGGSFSLYCRTRDALKEEITALLKNREKAEF